MALRLYANVACLDEYKLLNPNKIRGYGNSASVYDQVKALDAESQLEGTETIRARRFCELLIGQLPQSRQISMVDRDTQWSVHWEEVVSNAKEGVSVTRVPIMLIKEGQLQDLIEGCKSTVSTIQEHAPFTARVNSNLISQTTHRTCQTALRTIWEFCEALEGLHSSCENGPYDKRAAATVDAITYPTSEDTASNKYGPSNKSDYDKLGNSTEADSTADQLFFHGSTASDPSLPPSSRPSKLKFRFGMLKGLWRK